MKTVFLYDDTVTLEFDEGKHVYTWKEKGLPVRGVTTVLKCLNKPALIQWAANMAVAHIQNQFDEWFDYDPATLAITINSDDVNLLFKDAKTAHRRLAKDAADIGTQAHAFCEEFIQAIMDGTNKPELPEHPKVHKACKAFLDWYEKHDIRPIALEHILFSKEHYFAGTCDFYGMIDGELCALDFKTSSGIYPEMVIQVNGAYALALEEMYGKRVNASWIIRLDKKTGKFESYRIPRSDEDQMAFRVLLEVDKHMKRLDEKVKELRK